MKLIKCIKRLWLIGTCTHSLIEHKISDDIGKELKFDMCAKCGRIIGGVRYNNDDFYKTY